MVENTPTLRLVDRLRGKYVLPVNDGAGPLNGSMTFERQFETPPIQKEAASRIECLEAALTLIAELGGKTLLGPEWDADRQHELGAAKAFQDTADIASAALSKAKAQP